MINSWIELRSFPDGLKLIDALAGNLVNTRSLELKSRWRIAKFAMTLALLHLAGSRQAGLVGNHLLVLARTEFSAYAVMCTNEEGSGKINDFSLLVLSFAW